MEEENSFSICHYYYDFMSSLRVFHLILLDFCNWVQREALNTLLSNNFCANIELPLSHAFTWEGLFLENSVVVTVESSRCLCFKY